MVLMAVVVAVVAAVAVVVAALAIAAIVKLVVARATAIDRGGRSSSHHKLNSIVG